MKICFLEVLCLLLQRGEHAVQVIFVAKHRCHERVSGQHASIVGPNSFRWQHGAGERDVVAGGLGRNGPGRSANEVVEKREGVKRLVAAFHGVDEIDSRLQVPKVRVIRDAGTLRIN